MELNLALLARLALCGGVFLLTLVLAASRRSLSVGLPAAYLSSLATNHWFGALIHALPWFANDQSYYTELGFDECCYGTLALGAGCLVASPVMKSWLGPIEPPVGDRKPLGWLPEIYLFGGVLSYVVLMPLLQGIPSFAAVSVCGVYLVVVGFCLACWRAGLEGRRLKVLIWLGLSLGIPVVTILSMGFLGFGVTAALAIWLFVAVFFRPRWVVFVGIGLTCFAALSVFVNYMRDRVQIRDAVWGGAAYDERLVQLRDTLANFEWINLANEQHLRTIDLRLNQNLLVGAAREYIESGAQEYARGSTLRDALIALIPRIIWPSKPVGGGGGGTVTMYTGIEFAEGTSVGVGQIMEFYINFGRTGVLMGFFVLGLLLRAADATAAWHLQSGHWTRFVFYFLPALSTLNTLGSLVEITSTAAASVVLVLGLNQVLPTQAAPRDQPEVDSAHARDSDDRRVIS